MLILLLVFVAVPAVELYLLIEVGSQIGAAPTIALTVLTAMFGGLLVRLQGFATLSRARDAAGRGEVPALEMVDGVILLVAGLALLLPGFVTDALGFSLLVPPLRRCLIALFLPLFPPQAADGRAAAAAGSGPRVIEGEYQRERD